MFALSGWMRGLLNTHTHTHTHTHTQCDKAAIKGEKYHGKSVYSVMPSAIELEIMKHGPVEAAFTVYQGVFRHMTTFCRSACPCSEP